MATQKVVVGQSNISAGQLQDLFRQIEDGSLDKADMQAFLEHRDPWARPAQVVIGQYKSGDEYWKALQEEPYHTDFCELHPSDIPLAQEKQTLKLVYVSMEDLGFDEGALYSDVIAEAQKRGYKLCPAEVGPALRLGWKKQKKTDWFCIGMEPYVADEDSKNNPHIYTIGRDEDRDENLLVLMSRGDLADIEIEHSLGLIFLGP